MGQESTVGTESSPSHIFFGTIIFLLTSCGRQLSAQFEEPAKARRKAGLSVPCLAFAWRGRVEVADIYLFGVRKPYCVPVVVYSAQPPAHGESYFLTHE